MQFTITQIALSDSLSVERRLREGKDPWSTPMHLAQRRKYRRSFTILDENKFQPGSHELSAKNRMWSLFNFQPHEDSFKVFSTQRFCGESLSPPE